MEIEADRAAGTNVAMLHKRAGLLAKRGERDQDTGKEPASLEFLFKMSLFIIGRAEYVNIWETPPVFSVPLHHWLSPQPDAHFKNQQENNRRPFLRR